MITNCSHFQSTNCLHFCMRLWLIPCLFTCKPACIFVPLPNLLGYLHRLYFLIHIFRMCIVILSIYDTTRWSDTSCDTPSNEHSTLQKFIKRPETIVCKNYLEMKGWTYRKNRQVFSNEDYFIAMQYVPGEISYNFATHTAAVFLTYGS